MTDLRPQPLLPWAKAYDSLGMSTIPLPASGKAARRTWKKYQTNRPDESELVQWFGDTDNGNRSIAIVCGQVSGGLLVRDFDAQSAYRDWKRSHPTLARTLPTVKTHRAYHVYGRCAAYKRQDADSFVLTFKDGELRGDGHYVVAPPSLHPASGLSYEWLIPPKQIPVICLEDFGIPQSGAVTQEVCVTPSACSVHSSTHPFCVTSVADAITATLPVAPGQRHRQLFEFARYLRGLDGLAGLPADALLDHVQAWHRSALPIIRTKDFEETWVDFQRAWPKVRVAAGQGAGSVSEALAKAKENPPPPEAGQFIIPEIQLLMGLCRELQIQRGERPFYLSCRDAARALGLDGTKPHVRAWRWLKMLQHVGILELVKSGSQRNKRANEYRYLPLAREACWDLSPFDLTNPNDISSAHQMLVGLGHWQDGHEGLFKFAMATVMARRLANCNPAGYLARIVKRGLWGDGLHGPAEQDEIAAKEILRKLEDSP